METKHTKAKSAKAKKRRRKAKRIAKNGYWPTGLMYIISYRRN